MPKYKVYRIIEAVNRDDARKKLRKQISEAMNSFESPDHLVNRFFVERIPE